MTIATHAAEWVSQCRAEGKLASTMRNYTYALNGILLPWCQREGISDLEDLDQAAFNRLSLELLDRQGHSGPISKYTVQAYLRPIRHFIDWLAAEGHQPNGRPRLPRTGRARPKDVLSRDEIQRMEDACRLERDKLLVRLLADTGMRISEAINLPPKALQERQRKWFLYVVGKGENDRYVPVPRLWRRLQRWVERGRPQPCAERIFVALRSDGYYRQLGYSGAYEVVRNAAAQAGIQKRVHPHLLRHSLITHLRRKGYNDAQISMVVGNFSRLDVYTHLEAGDAYSLLAELD